MSLDDFITNVSSIRVPSLVATNPLAKEMVDSKLILRAATTAFETNVVWRVKPAEDMRTEPAMHDDHTAGFSSSLCVSVASARPPAGRTVSRARRTCTTKRYLPCKSEARRRCRHRWDLAASPQRRPAARFRNPGLGPRRGRGGLWPASLPPRAVTDGAGLPPSIL